ncbi:MAG: DUF1592 domain-containing protein [Myxococcota bacterium]
MRRFLPLLLVWGCSSGGSPAGPLPVRSQEADLRRLTQIELRESLRYVLGDVEVELTEPDLYQAGFARVGAREVVTSQSAVERLTLSVEAAIDRVFSDPARRDRVLGCDATSAECAQRAVARLGPMAWRRPLTTEESTRLQNLAAECSRLTSQPVEGARCAVSGLLLSPHFLYRVELPNGSMYQDYAMASRLSFLLWSAPPDDTLLAAAAAGELDSADGVRRHAERMLEDPRAREGLRSFVDEWYRLDRLQRLERDILAYTEEPVQFALADSGQLQPFLETMAESAREELRRMVVANVFDDNADYLELLTTDRTFVNRELELFYARQSVEGDAEPIIAPGFENYEEPIDCFDGCGDICEVRCGEDEACFETCEPRCQGYCAANEEPCQRDCVLGCFEECGDLACEEACPASCTGACESGVGEVVNCGEECDEDCAEECPDEECRADCRSECVPICEAFNRSCEEGCALECDGSSCRRECTAECEEERLEEEGPCDGPCLLVTEGEPDADGWMPARHAAESPRRGILGTMAILAQLGKQNETSPTRRGLYVMEHVACLDVGEPPDEIDLCERPEGVTRRESMEQHHVCAPSCAGCHQQMDPLGFTLDGFDTIGRSRTEDDWGHPLDTQVTWTLASNGNTTELPMNGLRSLAETFRDQTETERCVSRQFYRFATGHEEANEAVIDRLAASFSSGGRRLRRFLVDFVASDAFRRVPEVRPRGPIPAMVPAVAEEVFLPRCAPCHVGRSLGMLDLQNDASLEMRLRGPSTIGMPLITPGDLNQSYLWHKVQGTHATVGGEGDAMPPSGTPLTERERQGIQRLIEEMR